MLTAAIWTGLMSIVIGICLPASAVTMVEALMLANRSESALPYYLLTNALRWSRLRATWRSAGKPPAR